MTYRLNFPTDVFDTYKQLPELARRDLALALVDAQRSGRTWKQRSGKAATTTTPPSSQKRSATPRNRTERASRSSAGASCTP